MLAVATHLTNITSKWESSPIFRVNIKNLWNHNLLIYTSLKNSTSGSASESKWLRDRRAYSLSSPEISSKNMSLPKISVDMIKATSPIWISLLDLLCMPKVSQGCLVTPPRLLDFKIFCGAIWELQYFVVGIQCVKLCVLGCEFFESSGQLCTFWKNSNQLCQSRRLATT